MKKAKKILSFCLALMMLMSAVPTFAGATDYSVGDIIQFGSYPQSEVKDESTINALNQLAPTWDNWIDYGYYSGDGNIGSMKQGNWMKYTDILYNDVKYRGVKFTQYRPHHTYSTSSAENSYQDDNGYSTDVIYWFKFEPLNWKILDPNTGFVMCETIIDCQAYSNTIFIKNGLGSVYSHFNDIGHMNYANDYETSSIRNWLNKDFYSNAFNTNEHSLIKKTTINNNSYHTLIGNSGYEKLDSNQTTDKIYLISYDEAMNNSFGFAGLGHTETRTSKSSDYAKSQGIKVFTSIAENGNSRWHLRTPGSHSDRGTSVSSSGFLSAAFDIGIISGVRPALNLKRLDVNTPCEHANTVNHNQVNSTCIDIGFTAGVYCNDCENWISGHETIAVGDHIDNNQDGKCDYCGYDATKDCSCNCHKGGISGFFFKLINFFEKLFGKNKVCKCGVKH